ncbi:helix-turn-helix domain-containing protein [Nocardia australiensis]|uniref:helix-turn-helix domain-containing protein n=1 Tax=Nocardia australiensis TaxID=2887191 RepID=UPI001D1500D0|nr:helix-turn-helix domain-containing protein [Nocardia australiensis]
MPSSPSPNISRRSPRHGRPSDPASNGDISDDADDAWLTTEDVARRLKIPQKTLAAWASKRRGPQYVRMGRYRRYRLSDLRAWEKQQPKLGAKPGSDSPATPRPRSRGQQP